MLVNPEPTNSIVTDSIMAWKRYVMIKRVEKAIKNGL